MGMNYDPHALSHYGGSPTRTDANRLRDKKCTEMLGKFIDILKRTKEAAGSSFSNGQDPLPDWGFFGTLRDLLSVAEAARTVAQWMK